MNDDNEELVRQSNWSGRKIILFYWFAIVFLGTSAAAGLGTSVFKPVFNIEQTDPHAGITEPWHANDCVACHPAQVAGWETTWHAQLVGEYDLSNPTLNGSRMSYNSTHYWRTPKSDITQPNYWTYNQIFNASGQQCCMTTRWVNTTLINVTTGDVLWTNDTLVAQYGGNIWDIGVSCAACHTNPGEKSLSYTVCSNCHIPGGNQWMGYIQSNHYNSLDDLLASGDTQTLLYGNDHYIGQITYMNVDDLDESEYYRITCVTCHNPHDSTVNADDESNAMSPWTNPYTGEKFGPGGSQLRAATVNDLCGTCHDTNLNTTTGSYLDPSNHTTLDCTDCHGYMYTPTSYFPNGTVDELGEFSSLQHDWKFGGGEPADPCGLCHGDENATVYASMLAYQALYGNINEQNATYYTKLATAVAVYDLASGTVGVDAVKLANAFALIEEAKVLQAKSETLVFHNPDTWSLALTKLDDAIVAAVDALPDVTTTTTTPTTTITTEPPTTTTTTEPPTTTITTEPSTTTTTEQVTTAGTDTTTTSSTTEELSDTTSEFTPTIQITPGLSAFIMLLLSIILIPIRRRQHK
jgi:hypothetical protein